MLLDKLQPTQDKILTLKVSEKNLKECIDRYFEAFLNNDTSYCNFTFDSYLCWPPTEANTIVRQPCPQVRLSDPSQFASRRCGPNGTWHGRPGSDTGWTNYTSCLPANFRDMVSEIIKDDDKYNVILGIRYMEIVGFIVSFLFLCTSLYILIHFTVLHNTRNKIHMHLFAAMTVQTLSRLVIYFDQLFNVQYGISHTPIVCESCYVVLECTYTAMFAWMLIEGIYLRYLISKKIMNTFDFKVYCWSAWGATIVFTLVWALITKPNHNNDCWFGYNFEASYWIMQAPRFVVIMINMVILVLLLKRLYSKLDVGDTEIKKLKTSVRVATILLPLLGIVNVLNMIDVSISTSTWIFAIWSYTSHFLRSFQGFYLSLFYCLCNGEVRETLKRKFQAIRFWRGFNKSRANKRADAVKQLLSNDLLKNVPPPPFFRIDSSGNPTTRLECGCQPRHDIHERCCPLNEEYIIDMENCCTVTSEPSTPTTPYSIQTENEVVQLVTYPEIHAPPQRRQRQRPIEIIELMETTV